MKLKNILKAGAIVVSCAFTLSAVAAPNTVPAKIKLLRPYTNGTMFVQIASSSLATGASCTSVYRVKSDDAGAKAVIATLLTAYALDNDIELEIPTSSGCEGFGTPIQSVYLR